MVGNVTCNVNVNVNYFEIWLTFDKTFVSVRLMYAFSWQHLWVPNTKLCILHYQQQAYFYNINNIE